MQTKLGSIDLGCTSFKGNSYTPLDVFSCNRGLHFTPPTSPNRDNLKAQLPFRRQQLTEMLQSKEIYGAPIEEGMMSAAQKCTPKQPQILNIPKMQSVEGMDILLDLGSCFPKYLYVNVLASIQAS